MTATKDPSYFAYGVGPDGKLLWGNPEMHKFRVRSVPEYERLFAEAGDAVAIGEASTTFSSAPQSATRIHWLLPAARIICSLCHPPWIGRTRIIRCTCAIVSAGSIRPATSRYPRRDVPRLALDPHRKVL